MKGFEKCVAVRICPRFCFCGESISKNAFRWFESVYRPKMPEMHLQNFEKLQSRKKKVQRLMGRIYEPLLVPKLIRILRSTCTSLSDARGASERFKSVGEAQPTEKGMPSAYPFLLAGMAGFEPTSARVKVWCLTAWRHPNNSYIISRVLFLVKPFLRKS